MNLSDLLDIPALLSLAQDKLASTQDKVSSKYDTGIVRALNSVGLERKSDASSDFALYAGLFSAGILTGAALSLLFAPKSGKEMRRTVRRALPFDDFDDDYEDYELPRYDMENDRFRNIRRPRRSHRGNY